MSYTPDASLGGLVKGVVKDVVGDLASIPTEAARQAVGMPSREMNHDSFAQSHNHEVAKVDEYDKGDLSFQPIKTDSVHEYQREVEKSENHEESTRQVVYQDVSGDQVRQEQTWQDHGQAMSNNGNGQNVNSFATDANNDSQSDDGGMRVISGQNQMGQQSEQVKIETQSMQVKTGDVVFDWLSQAVWFGYGQS